MGTMLVRVARMVRRSPCQCVRFAHSQALRCRHASAADLISSVPIDLVLSLSVNGCVGSGATSGPDGLGSIGDTARLVRILRLVKLLKILRIIRLQTRFEELSDRAPALNTPLVKLLQPLFSTFYFAHILSCCFFAVGASVYYGAPPGSRAQLSSWLASSSLEMPEAECDATLLNHTSIFEKSDGIVVYDVDDWRDATDEERALMMQDWEIACGRPQLQWAQAGPAYTASLYWTFTTITTVGYGDLIPKATSERAFAIFAMCIGTGLFGYIISAMTNTLSDTFKGDAVTLAKFKALQTFMSAKELPFELKVRIRRHFRYLWSRSISLDVGESEIISQLSTPLRADTLRHMHRALIAENPIFRLVDDPTFRDSLIRNLQPSLVSPGDALMEQGTVGDEVFLLAQGTLEALYDPDHVAGTIAPNGTSQDDHSASAGGSGTTPDRKTSRCSLKQAAHAPAEAKASAPSSSKKTLGSAVLLGVVSAGHEHSIVGEIALLPELFTSKLRTATVQAQSHCELYSIRADAFRELCNDYPAAKEKLVALGKQRVQRLKEVKEGINAAKVLGLGMSTSNLALTFGRKLKDKREAKSKEAQLAQLGVSPASLRADAPQSSPMLNEGGSRWKGLVTYSSKASSALGAGRAAAAAEALSADVSRRLASIETRQADLESQISKLTAVVTSGLADVKRALAK